MSEVETEYCVPCGLLADAEKAQHDLFETHGRGIDHEVIASRVAGHV